LERAGDERREREKRKKKPGRERDGKIRPR